MTDNDDLALYGAKLTPHKDGTSMTRPLALAALALLAVTSCAATLRVSGTAPVTLNDGSCVRPVESPATSPMWVIATAGGLTDSLWRNPGEPFAFAFSLPAGSYTFTAFARNVAGVSCSTSVQAEAVARPGKVGLEP